MTKNRVLREVTPFLKFAHIYLRFSNTTITVLSVLLLLKQLDDPVLIIKKASDTRWLSHDHAISTIRSSLAITFYSFRTG